MAVNGGISGGKWDKDEVKKATRYECENCSEQFRNADKLKLIKTLHPVEYNPDAPEELVSMHWNALYMPWASCDWGELVVEFLDAWAKAKRGDMEALIAFVTETLGEPWEEVTFFSPRREVKFESDYKLAGADLTPGNFWPLEHIRFMSVDVQIDHFWHAARAYAADGPSRLVSRGRLETWEQIRDRQLELGVKDECVVIDCGDDQPGVAEKCCEYGWRMLRGDDAVSFTHVVSRKGKKSRVQKVYSVPQKYDPAKVGKKRGRTYQYVIWARWSNPSVKGIVDRLIKGQGVYFGIPGDVGQVYLDQINGERLKQIEDRWGHKSNKWVEVGKKGCHMRDCECMNQTMAIIWGVFSGDPDSSEETQKGQNADG